MNWTIILVLSLNLLNAYLGYGIGKSTQDIKLYQKMRNYLRFVIDSEDDTSDFKRGVLSAITALEPDCKEFLDK